MAMAERREKVVGGVPLCREENRMVLEPPPRGEQDHWCQERLCIGREGAPKRLKLYGAAARAAGKGARRHIAKDVENPEQRRASSSERLKMLLRNVPAKTRSVSVISSPIGGGCATIIAEFLPRRQGLAGPASARAGDRP